MTDFEEYIRQTEPHKRKKGYETNTLTPYNGKD